MPMTAGVGQSPEPSQSLHRPTHLTDGFAKLVVQPEVFGTVTHAFSNGELQKTADTVHIRVNPRHLVERLCVDSAFQASAPEAPSEYLRTRATRLKCERIESDEIVLGNSKRNHSRFLLSFDVRFAGGTPC
ncbi:MAG: hypothetical protein WBN15_11645 [Polyangiales bacterium]